MKRAGKVIGHVAITLIMLPAPSNYECFLHDQSLFVSAEPEFDCSVSAPSRSVVTNKLRLLPVIGAFGEACAVPALEFISFTCLSNSLILNRSI